LPIEVILSPVACAVIYCIQPSL